MSEGLDTTCHDRGQHMGMEALCTPPQQVGVVVVDVWRNRSAQQVCGVRKPINRSGRRFLSACCVCTGLALKTTDLLATACACPLMLTSAF